MTRLRLSVAALTACIAFGACADEQSPPTSEPRVTVGSSAPAAIATIPAATTDVDSAGASEMSLGPEPTVVLAPTAAATPVPLEPAWSVPLPDTAVGEVAGTAEIVAAWLPDEHFVVGFDRTSGAERWRFDVAPDAIVYLHAAGDGMVIDARDVDNTSTWTDIGSDGEVRFTTEFNRSAADPRLDVRPDGLYQTTVFESGTVRSAVIDPVGGPVETWVGDPAREQWDGLVVVGNDGEVSTRRGVGEPLQPTGLVLGPEITSVALVGDRIVAYGADELLAYALDGTPLWAATYDGDGINTGLWAVSPQGTRLAVVSPPRLDIVDVEHGTVVMSTTMPLAFAWTTWPDRLVAAVEPEGDGSIGLLDYLTGEVTVTPTLVGRLVPDPASPFVIVDGADDQPQELIGLDTAGAPAWAVTTDPGARVEPVTGGAVVVSNGMIAMFEFPVTRRTG